MSYWAENKHEVLVNGRSFEEEFLFQDSSLIEDSSPTPPRSPITLPGINKITVTSKMPQKNKFFKIVRGQLPGCTKECFTGFVEDDKGVYKDGDMHGGVVTQFNHSHWQQQGFTAKQFKEKRAEVVKNVFQTEYRKSKLGGTYVTAEACFKVEIWPLAELEAMMDLLKAAEKEGKDEGNIIKILNGFVKKLQLTNESVKKNNPIIKFDLAQAMTEKETELKLEPNEEIENATTNEKVENEVAKTPSNTDDEGKGDSEAKGGTLPKMERKDLTESDQGDELEKMKIENKRLEEELMKTTITKDCLAEKVKEKETEIEEVHNRNQVLEEKIQASVISVSEPLEALEIQEIKEDIVIIKRDLSGLGQLKDDVDEVKAGMERVLDHMGENTAKKDTPKRKLVETLDEMEDFLKKHLKNPSIDTVKTKIKSNANKIDQLSVDLKEGFQALEGMETKAKEKHEEVIELIGKLNISTGISQSPYKRLLPIHMNLPNTKKIAVIGDRVLHILLHYNPSFRYDLMSEAFTKTGYSCSKKDLISRLGSSLGQWMENVPTDTEIILLSFGLDDTLDHQDIELQRKQKSRVDKEVLLDANQSTIISVAEKCVGAIETIAQKFPNAKIFYVLPPPSESEPVVVEQLRKELKAAWLKGGFSADDKSKVSLIDGADCLANIHGLEVPGKIPGHLSWDAGKKLALLIYTSLFPDTAKLVSNCCSTIHIEAMCNKDRFCRPDTDFGKNNACGMCNSKDHYSRSCPVKSFFKEQKVACGHCGTPSGSLGHHPDICKHRFAWCPVCSMHGHAYVVHRTTASVRVASARLGSQGLPFNTVDPDYEKKAAAIRASEALAVRTSEAVRTSGDSDITEITDEEDVTKPNDSKRRKLDE